MSQRKPFFRLLDVIQKVCSDDEVTDSLPVLQKERNEMGAEIEQDFPISVQVMIENAKSN